MVLMTMNRGSFSFLSGAGFTFLGAYLWGFAWLKPVFWFAVASTVLSAAAVPLALMGFFNSDIKCGFFSGLLASAAVVLITLAFIYTGVDGIHSLVSSLLSGLSVLLLLYAMKPENELPE